MEKRVIYYTDELNEEFSGIKRDTIKIDENYPYIRKNFFWQLGRFFVYRVFTRPFAYLYDKLKFSHKFVNKKVLSNVKGGYFVYGNHTLMGADAFIPNILNYPKTTYTVIHPDNISVKSTKTFIEMNGAFPIPATIGATRNFMNAMEKRCQKCAIQIYPEAHIWPFYTKVRPFKSVSFKYPVKFNKPCFCFTNTFHKKKFSSKPKVITYVDGPFYPNPNLPEKERVQDLRDRVYNAMKIREQLNTYEYITYIRKTDDSAKENQGEKND